MAAAFLRYLIYLIYKYYSMFSPVDIIICCGKKLAYNALNIITNITCLCKRCSVRNRKRNLKHVCKRLYKISLSASCRPKHKYIGFFNTDSVVTVLIILCKYSFIMIIHSNRQYLLSMFLSHNMLIKSMLYNVWRRKHIKCKFRLLRLIFFFFLFLNRLLMSHFLLNAFHIRQIHHK